MAQNNPSRRTKVLFLITKATWGGAQRYVWDMVSHLPNDRFLPIVAYGQTGRLSEKLNSHSIEGHHIRSLGRDVAIISDISSFFEILVCLRSVRPDVLHLNSSKAAALGALAARIIGVKRIVFTVHGWPFNEKRGELARVMVYLVSWLTAFLSHEVIVVSKSDAEQGARMRWIGDKIRYIPIGIEVPDFLSREEAAASLPLTSALPRIGTIAELTPNKGIRYAIEAISLMKERGVDASYYVIGDGEQREELEDVVAEFGTEENVVFAGFIADAARHLKAFDMFLLPSIKEGMPYVLLEAAAAGLPIVTTTVVNPEIAERYPRIRMVPPADPEGIAEALIATLQDAPEESAAQGSFPLSDMVAQTTKLYLPAEATT